MSFVPKPNTGTLFKNDYKKAENHPDYKGSLYDQHGAKWDLAAWIKEGQNGKFMSLKVSEPYVKGEPQRAEPQNIEFDDGSEIPF